MARRRTRHFRLDVIGRPTRRLPQRSLAPLRWFWASGQPWWISLPDDRLLRVRLSDLDLKLEGTWLEGRVERLHRELKRRGVMFKPRVWLSMEWFSPGETAGIAAPFYLAHPRLAELERRMMGQAEGGTDEWCMRLLRHEAGHAIETAYKLWKRADWRAVFGDARRPYPRIYQPRPHSRRFVRHLANGYAQCHPSEDFAETFAIWLAPNSQWRERYRDWPALAKLRFVDGLMKEVGGGRPRGLERSEVEPIRRVKRTLEAHYRSRRRRFARGEPRVSERALRRMFVRARGGAMGTRSAAEFLRVRRRMLRELSARQIAEPKYVIDRVLDAMIERVDALGLSVPVPSEGMARRAADFLARMTMKYRRAGGHRIAV